MPGFNVPQPNPAYTNGIAVCVSPTLATVIGAPGMTAGNLRG